MAPLGFSGEATCLNDIGELSAAGELCFIEQAVPVKKVKMERNIKRSLCVFIDSNCRLNPTQGQLDIHRGHKNMETTLQKLFNTTSFGTDDEIIRRAIKTELENNRTVLYFAYGSNMDLAQMQFRCPQAKLICKTRLNHFEFLINSEGYASVLPAPSQNVEGLLFELTDSCVRSLDHYEGVQSDSYTKELIQIEKFGLTNVLAYFATDNLKTKNPRPGYMEKIILAAELAGLSEDYVGILKHYVK